MRSRPLVVFLNGSINSGKSTIAKLLVEKIPRTALVEVDVLREMIPWLPIDEAVPINLDNAAAVIRIFAAKGFNAVIPYPLSQSNYERMTGSLKGLDMDIRVFTLAPRLEKALTDRGSRALTEQERERIKYHYHIGIHAPAFGETIDNSDQKPEETAGIILEKLNPHA